MRTRESTKNALSAIRFIKKCADQWKPLLQGAASLAENPQWRKGKLDMFDIGSQEIDNIEKFWFLALEEQSINELAANAKMLKNAANAWKKVPPIDLFSLYRAWQKSPVVLEFDGSLAGALTKSDIGTDVNISEFLGHLPFSTFFVSSDHLGFRLTGADGRLTRGLGFFVTVTWMPRIDQPHRVEQHLLVVPVDANRKMAPVVIPLRFKTFKELASSIAETHARANGSEGQMMRHHAEEDTRAILCFLLYLASEEPDIVDRATELPLNRKEEKSARKTGEEGPAMPLEPRELVIGSRTRVTTPLPAPTDASANSRTIAPHIRRAHFHTYITGSRSTGETKRVVRWVDQTMVNMENGSNPVMTRIVK